MIPYLCVMELDVKHIQSIFQSIFKVTCYSYKHRYPDKCKWPGFKLDSFGSTFFYTLEDAEKYVEHKAGCPLYGPPCGTYAYVVTEIPIGLQVTEQLMSDCFSQRVYLPDGSLWGANDYATIMQRETPSSMNELELGHYLGKRRLFHGRKPEEIRFQPGDIVEVFGYPGNDYWSDDEVNLAIVVKTPPTVVEVTKMRNEYMITHTGYRITDHSLGCEFDHSMDVYMVLPYNSGSLDRSPTIATMPPSLPISEKRKRNLLGQYERFLAGDQMTCEK